MAQPPNQPAGLSNADLAVLGALRFQKMLDSGGPFTPEPALQFPRAQLAAVRPQIDAESEAPLVSSPGRMLRWSAPGDGSYVTGGVPIVATGLANREGTTFALGAALGSAGANMLAKRKAKKDMQERWMEAAQGLLTVTTHGFYIQSPGGQLTVWGWGELDSVEVVGQSTLEVISTVQDWGGKYLISSDWAELMFVSWVKVCYAQHPRKYTWLPAGWRERATAALGHDPTEEPAVNA